MSRQRIGIGVDRLILTGTRFNYGTGVFFNNFFLQVLLQLIGIHMSAKDGIDVNQLKLTGTRFNYGTELLNSFNNFFTSFTSVKRHP
jgi:hypothetical protein